MSDVIEQDPVVNQTKLYILSQYALANNLGYSKDYLDTYLGFYKNLTAENALQTYGSVQLLSSIAKDQHFSVGKANALKMMAVCVGVAAISYGVNKVVKYYNSTTNRFSKLLTGIDYCSNVGTALGICGGMFCGLCWFIMKIKL